MFHFEAEDIQLDFIEILSTFGIPLAVYQRLEFSFRQIMMKSPAIQAEYGHYEPDFHVSDLDQTKLIDRALDSWHQRYPDQAYGLGPLSCNVAQGRAKAREMYRKAVVAFGEISDFGPLTDRWLQELNEKLKFHIGRNESIEKTPADDLIYYLAAAEIIYRPFFEMHFSNRRHTSEKLHTFLAMKLMLEAGHGINFADIHASSTSVFTAAADLERHIKLPTGWIEAISGESSWYAQSA